MSTTRLPVVPTLIAVVLLWVAPAPAGELLHGLPAWDSGWLEIPTGLATTLTHDIGGDVADYVVDLQFRDEAGDGVHHFELGGDSAMGDVQGAYWSELTTSTIKVVRAGSDSEWERMRVRIWVVRSADYDSGWSAITPGGTDPTFTHSLGGDPDDYVVDLQLMYMNGQPIINNLALGGDRHWEMDHVADTGAYWYGLTASQVKVHRGADDTLVNQVRLRIWRRHAPDYDSGWLTGSPQYYLSHNLGGPWNDFVVDLQFRDLDSLGVNQAGYGGDYYDDDGAKAWREEGAFWADLTGRSIRFYRNADDTAADEFRLRIWSSRKPKYDSSWSAIAQSGSLFLTHGLGGDPDTYVVDLQFLDTDADGNSGAGQNARGIGADQRQVGAVEFENHGAYWWYLTDTNVYVVRGPDDTGADQVRVRLWIAPAPDYDSDWTTMPADGTPQTFNHLAGGNNTDDYVVDLGLEDTATLGVTCALVGGDNQNTAKGLSYRGTYWWDLDTSAIKVTRGSDDSANDQARVRIWRNPSFDHDSGWVTTPPGAVAPMAHGLGIMALLDGVVDLQMDSDEPTVGVNARGLGGDAYYDLSNAYTQTGAHWTNLSEDWLSVWRGAQDLHADRTRIRIWRAAPPGSLFADGFESGDLTAWGD